MLSPAHWNWLCDRSVSSLPARLAGLLHLVKRASRLFIYNEAFYTISVGHHAVSTQRYTEYQEIQATIQHLQECEEIRIQELVNIYDNIGFQCLVLSLVA